MNQTGAVWLVVVLAVIGANVPFVSQKFLTLVPLRHPKSFWMRLLELIILYALVGWLGRSIEAYLGQAAVQRWEFYAVTAALFLTMAFPGFVYSYLLKRRSVS